MRRRACSAIWKLRRRRPESHPTRITRRAGGAAPTTGRSRQSYFVFTGLGGKTGPIFAGEPAGAVRDFFAFPRLAAVATEVVPPVAVWPLIGPTASSERST